jgi:hypothetical protein
MQEGNLQEGNPGVRICNTLRHRNRAHLMYATVASVDDDGDDDGGPAVVSSYSALRASEDRSRYGGQADW